MASSTGSLAEMSTWTVWLHTHKTRGRYYANFTVINQGFHFSYFILQSQLPWLLSSYSNSSSSPKIKDEVKKLNTRITQTEEPGICALTRSLLTFSVVEALQSLLWVFQVGSLLVLVELCWKGVFLVLVFLLNSLLSYRVETDGMKGKKRTKRFNVLLQLLDTNTLRMTTQQ